MCGVPCIMEGETGVSKTALTRMLFMLKNHRSPDYTAPGFATSLRAAVADVDCSELASADHLQSRALLLALQGIATAQGYAEGEGNLKSIPTDVWSDDTLLSIFLCTAANSFSSDRVPELATALFTEIKLEPGLLATDSLWEALESILEREDRAPASPGELAELLIGYVISRASLASRTTDGTHWTFHQVNVHAALTPAEIEAHLAPVVRLGERLIETCRLSDESLFDNAFREIKLCIFLDEVNTSSTMGMFKELIVDHRLSGRDLPKNIVVIAACNPAREKLVHLSDVHARREELGQLNAMGHYQVHPLPLSIEQIVWDYGALTEEQEKEFVEKRLEALCKQSDSRFPVREQLELAALLCKSQSLTRDFAREQFTGLKQQIIAAAPRPMSAEEKSKLDADLEARANSVVSLRDIQRVFSLFRFFQGLLSPSNDAPSFFTDEFAEEDEVRRRSMLLTIGVVYYLRLKPVHRVRFESDLHGLPQERARDSSLKLDAVLNDCMDTLIDKKNIQLEAGIARTTGLKENVFMVVVCCLARVPLMIIGPPGSSKTLAVTVTTENAKGKDSRPHSFFRSQRKLLSFHYQCSRRSTSTEIEAVFERAIEKQRTTYGDTSCFVFMDEAGLPEEQRESLKVLHYYLEDHMSRAARVGFVAITNHALDAAKQNRCAVLLRAEPDHKELMEICVGCLGSEEEQRRLLPQQVVGLELRVKEALECMCTAYQELMHEAVEKLEWYNTFFGLRDFMHFIKLLARQSVGSSVSLEKLVLTLERNMNGVEREQLQELISFWRGRLGMGPVTVPELRNSFALLRESLAEQSRSERPISRYKLLIDTTIDDSILRVLRARHDLDGIEGRGARILKLSDFPEDSGLQQVTLVSSVKYAAEKGEVVVLSHTEKVNESFYDLFNQHFQAIESRDASNQKTTTFHANIAVGSHSTLCHVAKGFECIVHVRNAPGCNELRNAPAPFLHRFEKYRLSHRDLLNDLLAQSGRLAMLITKVLHKLQSLIECIDPLSFYGFRPQQTVESILHLLVASHLTGEGSSISEPTDDMLAIARVELEDDDEALASLAQGPPDFRQLTQRAVQFLSAPSGDGSSSAESRAAVAIVGQWLLQNASFHLLQICTPERLYQRRESLPPEMLSTYFKGQEHFSLKRLIKAKISDRRDHKLVVYTRTTASLLALPMHGMDVAAQDNTMHDLRLLEALVCEPFTFLGLTWDLHAQEETVTLEDFVLCPLSQLTTQEALVLTLRSFAGSSSKRFLAFFIDMAETPTSRVNFVRLKIDEMLGDHTGKSVALVLHFPGSNVYVQACYDTTVCDKWESIFLDSVSEEASALGALDVSEWLKLGVSNDSLSLVDTKKWDLLPALYAWIDPALTTAASRITFASGRSADGSFNPSMVLPVQGRVKLLDKLMRTRLGDVDVQHVLLERYSQLWTADNHSLIRDRLHKATQLLASGQLRVSLVEAITGELRETFFNYLSLMIWKMNENFNLDILDDDGLASPKVLDLFLQCLRLIPVPPVPELKLLTQSRVLVISSLPPSPSLMFPFFSLVSSIFVQATDEIVASAAERELSEEDIIDLVQAKVQQSDAPMANVAQRMAACGTDESDLWDRYLAHFVSKLFADSPGAERRMVCAWLGNRCHRFSNHLIASLHVAARRHEKMIRGLAAMLRPLSMLVDGTQGEISPEFEASMMHFGESTIDSEIHRAIIEEFFRQMHQDVHGDDPAQAGRWARTFAVVDLNDLVLDSQGSHHRESAARLLVMGVVQAAACSGDLEADAPSLRRFTAEAEKAIGTEFRLEQIWRVADETFPARLALKQRILSLWCSTARFEQSPLPDIGQLPVRSDVNFLLNTLIHEQHISSELSISVLEALLSGPKAVAPFTDQNIDRRGVDSTNRSEVLGLIERHLAASSPAIDDIGDWDKAYMPPWFEQGAAHLNLPVAHAYFNLAIKQLLMKHQADTLEGTLIMCSKLKQEHSKWLRPPRYSLETAQRGHWLASAPARHHIDSLPPGHCTASV